MQVPVLVTVCDRMHAATRKLAGDVVILCLAGALAAAGFIYLPKLAPSVAPEAAKQVPAQDQAKSESGETAGDFLERVARAHVASLWEPSSPPIETAVQTNELATASRSASLLRRGAAHAGKARVADASTAKSPLQAQSPAGANEPAVAPKAPPASAKIDWLAPLHYGMELAADAGKIVAASNARVMQTIASAGDTLSSFGKKQQE